MSCGVPTLAKVSGACLGGGFELALACSMTFCDEGASLGVPEIQLGVFPPPASALLPFMCSDTFARQMILTGDKFSADQLYGHGLVNAVAKTGTLDDEVSSFVTKHFLPKSASSLRMANRAAQSGKSEYYKHHIGAIEKLYLDDLMATADAVEGIQSFLEKRPPKWKDA